MSALDYLADIGRSVLNTSMDDMMRTIMGSGAVSESERMSLMWTFTFCNDWVLNGCQTYTLNHSMAALLAATRSPEFDVLRTPHEHFIVSVPSQFLPVDGNFSSEVIVAVIATPKASLIGILSDSLPAAEWMWVRDQAISEDDSKEARAQRKWLLAIRMVSNVVAFVTEHRECVERVSKAGAPRTVHNVSPPRDVVIDRAFRDRVAALARAGTQSEVRSALAHVVRGHWRNQACGAGFVDRRLTWVRPHRRGDTSNGIVVARNERIQRAER